MTDKCKTCGGEIGYDTGFDDPPEGEGHIEAVWNPSDEPSYVVGASRLYCSINCLVDDADELPFEGGDQE